MTSRIDVAGSEAGIVGGAAGAHAFNGRAMHALGNVELLAHVGREIGHGQAELAALLSRVGVAGLFALVVVELADSDVDGLGLAVAQNAQINGCAGRGLADGNLKGAAVVDLFAVQFSKHVAALRGRRGRRASRA